MKKKYLIFNLIIMAFTISSVLLAFFYFNKSYFRLFEGLKDLWNSVRYYFCYIFNIENTATPTVDVYSTVFTKTIMPQEYETFKQTSKTFFELFFDGQNFQLWINELIFILSIIVLALSVLVPCYFLLKKALKKIYFKPNNRYNHDTRALKIFKKATKKYISVKRFITDFFEYLRKHDKIVKIWIVMWIFNLNLATIIVEFIAYYLYFAVSFKVFGIYRQVYKLSVDLGVVFNTVPIYMWVIIAYILFDLWRKKKANKRLRHFEARNCGMINELPITSISCGSMGKKKTTLITDMTLSQEVMFRQKALEIIQRNDIKFPFFSWISFEKEIQACIDFGKIYNLATLKEWLKLKRKRFYRHNNANYQLYGYDIERYGFYYNNGLYKEDLFSVLETYGQAYFIYVVYSSLIVSNYSIMTDNEMIDSGNFPMWVMDFFPKKFRESKRHSHILDFDILRLGRKVLDNNENIGSFEFGVIAITEIGKERGNNLELQEIKKKSDETNQKNDLFNAWLKMCRHSATVDNYPFIKVFTDEQRPESWGADARDLCDVLSIAKSGESNIALPFYTIEEMIAEWSFNKFCNLYYDLRFYRGDNTLVVYILKHFVRFIYRRNIQIFNRYGYSTLSLEKERGTMDGKIDRRKYFLMNAKIYRKRFSTDCFSDYFNELAKKTKVGLEDYKEYLTEKASIEELKMQNSYFVNGLYKDEGVG